MSQVFISYAHGDREAARSLAQLVEAEGYSVWWDRELAPGDAFSEVIEKALDGAQAVVALWSEASRKSHWVRDEAAVGRDRNRLVPVALDAAPPPLGFRQIHTIEVASLNADQDARRSFLTSLAHLCAREPPAAPDSAREAREGVIIAGVNAAPNDKPLRKILNEEKRQRSFVQTFWISSLAVAVPTTFALVLAVWADSGMNVSGAVGLSVAVGFALVVGRFLIVVGRRLSKRKSARYFDAPTMVALGLSIGFALLVFFQNVRTGGGLEYSDPGPGNTDVIMVAVASGVFTFPIFAALSIPIGFLRGLTRKTFEEGR